jgi:VIT1/CCC1 family predicted Fe2+/Mn2+ transporter
LPDKTPRTDSLARLLVLDEIFDLSLYEALRGGTRGRLREVLDELVRVETRHVAFWKEFFGLQELTRLDLGRRVKLLFLTAVCRALGATAVYVVLEAIEVHGVRKYLRVWQRYEREPLGTAVRGILEDEFRHEDLVVTGDEERRVRPQRVRDVFLGLNDGLVEILGAVSGFFAAFGESAAVLAGSFTVAVAGAISMAAGAYVAVGSEAEVRATEEGRRRFLGEAPAHDGVESPLRSALVVGLAYFAGAMVPVLPVAFGATGMLPTVLTAGTMIVAVSALVAFVSGMNVRRRIVLNLVVMGVAVAVTYAIGLATKALLGVAL